MKFQHFGTIVILVGLHPTDHSLQEGNHFLKKPVRKGILLQIVSLGSTTTSSQPCDPTIKQILFEFAQYLPHLLVYIFVEVISIRYF